MTSTTLELRDARATDAATIVDYNLALAHETEHKTLDASVLQAGVRALLTDPARGRYFVAVADGLVVGQIMVTYEWSDWRNGWFWWLQSVYVHRDYRRLGVFRSILAHIEQLARAAADVAGIRLYMETDNDRARQTYAALGFAFAHYHVYEKLIDPRAG